MQLNYTKTRSDQVSELFSKSIGERNQRLQAIHGRHVRHANWMERSPNHERRSVCLSTRMNSMCLSIQFGFSVTNNNCSGPVDMDYMSNVWHPK